MAADEPEGLFNTPPPTKLIEVVTVEDITQTYLDAIIETYSRYCTPVTKEDAEIRSRQ